MLMTRAGCGGEPLLHIMRRIAPVFLLALAPVLSLVAQAPGATSPEGACPTAAPGTEVTGRADSAGAGARARADSGRPDSARRIGERPDIILRASVSAREVRFASAPRVSIRLCGGTLDSVRVLERRNLPKPVVAGTTYHDVYVAIEILGHLNGQCIASAVTGGAGRGSDPCAAIGIRDSGRARTTPPARRRPQ